MRTLLCGVTAAVLLAASHASAADTAAQAWTAAPASADRMGPWGFDLAGRDLSVAPGKDFYTYANGDYVKALVIPADRSRYGAFDTLTVLSEARVRALLEAAAANTSASGDTALVGGFYKAFMDEARVEALDAKPLAADLAAVRAADTRSALAALMGKANTGFFSGVFATGIGVDAKAPGRYTVYVGQAGLGLPDRDYYLQASFAPQKAAYQLYVATMLKAIDWPDADAQAAAIVAMETAIAEASWTKVQQRDPVASYNAMSPADLAALAPGFDWKTFFAAADLGAADRVVVGEKSAFPKIAAIFAATPIATLQAWQAFSVADDASPACFPKRFADANFRIPQTRVP